MASQVKIHQIRTPVEVARQGSIHGTSRVLNMSQPALSKSVQELEEGLAAQLSFRRSKGVTLTGVGENFYQHASLILEELRAAQKDIRQQQGQLAGQISIGTGASISRSSIPVVTPRFHRQYPQIEVRIMEGQLMPMVNELCRGESDFTINTYYQGPCGYEFTFEKLLEEQFAIFCRPGYPAIGAHSIKQLLDYGWTVPTSRGSYYKQLSELFDGQAQVSQVGVVCEMFSACISLVVESDFFSILSEEAGCDLLYRQGLVMLPANEILPKAVYYLIQWRDSRRTPLTVSLITQFRREHGYLQS